MLEALMAIDWNYWLYDDIPVKFGWPEIDLGTYLFTCRLACWTFSATFVAFALSGVAYIWSRHIGPLTLWDSD